MKVLYKECPYCGEKIRKEAKKCRYCHEFLEEIHEKEYKHMCECGWLVEEGDEKCPHCGSKLDWGGAKTLYKKLEYINNFESEAINKNIDNSKKGEIIAIIILSIFIIFSVSILSLTSQSLRPKNVSTSNTMQMDNNFNNIEEVVLGKGAYWGMTLDEVKILYSLNERDITEGFDEYLKDFIDTSKYRKIEYIGDKEIEYIFWFFKYDNAFRLYDVEIRYIYNIQNFENFKRFLDENFGNSTERTVHNCLDCKEGYKYRKGNTSAYLKTQYEYLGSDKISNIIIEYESDEMVDLMRNL